MFSSIFKYFRIFRHYVGRRLYVLLALGIGVALAEGLGITMLLPLLKVVEGGGPPDNQLGRIFYDALSMVGVEDSLIGILVVIGVVFVLKGIFFFCQYGYRGYLQAQLLRELKTRMFDAYSNMDYNYYMQKNTGHFINIINNQISGFYGSFNAYTTFLSQIILAISYFTLAFFITWQFALMAIGAGLLILFIFRTLNVFIRNLSRKVSIEGGNLNTLLIQAIQAFKYLASTNTMEHPRSKAMKSIYRLTGYELWQRVGLAFTHAIREPVSILLIIGIVVIQVMILGASLTPIFVAILLFYRGTGTVLAIQSGWQDTMSMIGGVEMVHKEFAILAENRESSGEHVLDPLCDKIELRNVSFTYQKVRENVFNNINVCISANTTVAIVGESGSGKSTLIDMLTLMLKPQSGEVLIDGVPGHEIELKSWRKQIGYVSQETVMFDDTIANNISLWYGNDGEASIKSQIRNAARSAHIAEYICTLEEGYDTVVGDRGIRLSGGQRQRLFIARELFKNPKLLILDEATSALDTESEHFIQKSIDDLKGKMTVVIIAHRLSTIRNVDYLYVLDKGKVVEEGTYRHLKDHKQSRFRKMVDMQIL